MKPLNFVFPRALFVLAFSLAAVLSSVRAEDSAVEFPFKANDRVAWIGSSSTRIGTWCRTMEFLLRTRHPELKLTFNRNTTGGGTFVTGVKNLPVWLSESKPTLVLFNYGGNDAAGGAKGLPQFKQSMQKCQEIARDFGARVLFTTHQSGDVRATDVKPFDNRRLCAEEMLAFAKENGWPIYDTHHPLEKLQLEQQKLVPDYTINKDRIHLTDSAYVAWGFYLYDCMNPPAVESMAALSADGKVLSTKNCRVTVSESTSGALEFTRADDVLPLLPPDPVPSGNPLKLLPTSAGAAVGMALKDSIKDYYKPASATKPADPLASVAPSAKVAAAPSSSDPTVTPPIKTPALPPFKIPAAQVAFAAKHGQELPSRELVPLEKYSRYMLKVTGLEAGIYAVSCEGKPVGTASEKDLADGVNLNTLLLDSKNPAPWAALVKNLWLAKNTDEIGRTKWKFRIEKK